MNTRLVKRARGAAAVELAITMVVLVPLMFFALFLQDFVYYRLNGQEPVLNAQLDHVTPDYMNNDPDVGGQNRLKYCDHTSAYDSYEQGYDCNGDSGGGGGGAGGPGGVTGGSAAKIGHHHATGAHQCWLGGGQQLQCGNSKTGGIEIVTGTAMTEFHATGWNKGGLMTCSAQLNVFNWIIPRQINQEGGWLWSKKANTNKTQYGKKGGGSRQGETQWDDNAYGIGDVHTDGSSTGSNSGVGDGESEMGSWLMSKEELAQLVDPWALTHIDTVKPLSYAPATDSLEPGKIPGTDSPYNPLLSRTGHYYNKYASNAVSSAESWQSGVKDFLSDNAFKDGYGDTLKSVPVMWSPDKTRPGYKGGYASGYADSRQANVNRSEFPQEWGPK
ncbi:MAG: hypothetical protein U0228_18080 [Myxococcaceae bacterium]